METRRIAQTNGMEVGDRLLLQQQNQNKLTPVFEADPYRVVDRCGNQVTVESPTGVRYKRNISHTKKYQEPVVTADVGLSHLLLSCPLRQLRQEQQVPPGWALAIYKTLPCIPTPRLQGGRPECEPCQSGWRTMFYHKCPDRLGPATIIVA